MRPQTRWLCLGLGRFGPDLTQFRFSGSHWLYRIVTRASLYQIKWATAETEPGASEGTQANPRGTWSMPISLLGHRTYLERYQNVTFGLLFCPLFWTTPILSALHCNGLRNQVTRTGSWAVSVAQYFIPTLLIIRALSFTMWCNFDNHTVIHAHGNMVSITFTVIMIKIYDHV